MAKRPETKFIKGSASIQLPVPVRKKGELVGYKNVRTDLIKLLRDLPEEYDPFREAQGYFFNTEEAKVIIQFIVNECAYPEGTLTGLPFIPEKWQWAIYLNMYCWFKKDKPTLRRYNEVFIYIPRKNGKLLDVNTPLVTPKGFVSIGDIQEGAVVFDMYGNPCTVADVHPVNASPTSYDVTFSNGESVKACADHQWFVQSRKQHPKYANKKKSANRKNGERTVTNLISKDLYEDVWTTQEMVDVGVTCSQGRTFRVPMHNGLETPETHLPVDPYLIGYWLGDGSSKGPYLYCSDDDAIQWGDKWNYKVTKQRTCCRVSVPELSGNVLGRLGLKGDKHIPVKYFYASRSQRIALLQGLMDSDGTISKRGTDLSFSNANKTLIEGIEYLLATLGLKYTTKEVVKRSQNGTAGTYYQVQFMAYKDTHPVFRLERKLKRQRLSTQTKSSRSRNCHVVSITPCDPVPMKCITVDSPTGTYLFGKTMIPTHNTTAFGAIPSLISLFVDPEKRSQNYCCAADVEQASLNFRHAAFMIESNPKLVSRLKGGKIRHSQRLIEHKNGRTLKVLSSIAETKHGLSPHTVGVDELHAHANSELVDTMQTGTAARPNPLTITTTTADYDRKSLCNDTHKRALQIARGTQSDPTFLPVVYQALPTDDWRDPKVWRKANPNFGISVQEEYFEKELRKIENSPSLLARFLRLHLNIKTAVETAWIYPHVWGCTNPDLPEEELMSIESIRLEMEKFPDWFSVVNTQDWASSTIDILLKQYRQYYTWFFKQVHSLRDEPYFAGYDHTAVKDVASLSLYFPEKRVVLWFCFVPADSIERRTVEDGVPYQEWHRVGLINHSPGETINEQQVIDCLVGKNHEGVLTWFGDCRMVAFDDWGSTNIHSNLERYGFMTRGYPQSYKGMNQPCKTTEAMLDQHSLFHGGHAVSSWMINHCSVTEDSSGHIRPSKEKSTDKIDNIVSYLMALGAWMNDENTVIESIPGLKASEDIQ